MNRTNRLALLVMQLSILAVASCDVAPNSDGKVYDVGVTTSALHDSFTTPASAYPATAVTATRVFNVWLAQTATGTQVVGQMFDLAGAPIGASRVYTNTAHAKFTPHVAYGAQGRFLIVYTDAYSSSDYDILGIIVDNNGVLVSTPLIDFSTAFDQQPKVAFVPTGINQWIVTYARQGSPNSIQAAYLDAAGTRGTSATIASNSAEADSPQVQYSISTQRLVFAWDEIDGTAFRFASTSLVVGPLSLVPFAPGHETLRPSLAYQPNTENVGIAVWDDIPFSNSMSARLLILWRGCESISCARPERSTGLVSVSSTLDLMGPPQLTALGSSFVIQNRVDLVPSPSGPRTIGLTTLDGDTGALLSTNLRSIPACSGSSPFGPDWVATSATTSGDRVSLVYDSSCSTGSKVLGQLLNTSLTRTNYSISD